MQLEKNVILSWGVKMSCVVAGYSGGKAYVCGTESWEQRNA
jgi:hypothetical protein